MRFNASHVQGVSRSRSLRTFALTVCVSLFKLPNYQQMLLSWKEKGAAVSIILIRSQQELLLGYSLHRILFHRSVCYLPRSVQFSDRTQSRKMYSYMVSYYNTYINTRTAQYGSYIVIYGMCLLYVLGTA